METDIRFRGVAVRAPGRINIIGEHTDYNAGWVLPAAIDKYTTVKLRRNGTVGEVSVTDLKGEKTFVFNLHDFAPAKKDWPHYIIGVVKELQKRGAKIEGFEAEFESEVPMGAGMSSSAALECSFAVGINELFDLGFDKWQLIKAAQMAEHNFVGTQCGIMDQFASVMGKKNRAILLDCRSLEYEYLPLALSKYQLLLLNTNVSHSLASSEYNVRRAECGEGVDILQKTYPSIKSLRDVNLAQLIASGDDLPEHIFRRCRHVVSENQRVMAAVHAMRTGDFQKLGEAIYQSHFSLKNDYKVSCPELDFLVRQAKARGYVLGSRMMGGGFGGCTISLIDSNRVGEFVEQVSAIYRKEFGTDLTPIEVGIGEGASILPFP